MMILKLFRTREQNLLFSEKDWTQSESKNNYLLTLELGRIKIRSSSRFVLFVLQGSRYVFLTEGSEVIKGSSVQYVSHFPFEGKVVIK